MLTRAAAIVLALAGVFACTGCKDWFNVVLDSRSTVRIKLVNTSETQFVRPNIGVCPNGMALPPHHFMASPPVLAPGEEITLTTGELGGADGNCITFSTNFMIGMCDWQYGPAADDLASAGKRYGGQIGFQFRCGDTVILRWSDEGEAGGTWTSEVETATGNEPPAADFQLL